MENIIIIAIVLAIVFGNIIYLYKAKKRGETCIGCPYAKQCANRKNGCGGGGCCGGGGSYRTKKKLSNIIYRKSFQVEGMHCEHCRNRVEEAVNDIKGVSGKVNLKKETLTVSYAEKVSDDIIISRIEKAGYMVKR